MCTFDVFWSTSMYLPHVLVPQDIPRFSSRGWCVDLALSLGVPVRSCTKSVGVESHVQRLARGTLVKRKRADNRSELLSSTAAAGQTTTSVWQTWLTGRR